ncbi:hypothetical protein HS088_TW16G00892 [Tripterygium wilfordii]|uniref:Wax synthase domain-containing protein n=1 Tax=Tripterygium wilfordii TaxID=458696 RepID=A0A7J7CK63_TRIWF|nr:hypothetical protein HS088_TW16G00892 [Tripterygium wilfordii]
MTSFFITWLANFKLLLFSFGQGPLASDPSISLPLFVAVACLPIKLQQNPSQKSPLKPRESPSNYAIKGLILVLMIKIYDYRDYMHPKMVLVLYGLHTYFGLEIILAMGAAMARTMTGLELEPQFNEPYLSTSLQDFWGKRWNLMVPSILRPTVYLPTIKACSRVIGRKWAPLPAVFATFVVSGIMHELIFYYLGRMRPTWEVMGFFLVHGLCLTAEIALKKAIDGRWRLHGLISGGLTIGFVVTTSVWIFLPCLSKSQIDVRSLEEYALIGAFIPWRWK